jgi:hypothetical protein
LAALAVALSIFAFGQTAALAQYPPPKGSLICSAAQARVVINGNVTLAVTLRDTLGRVMPGQAVVFSITAHNGTAYLTSSLSYTDAYGAAYTTVNGGFNSGLVSVTASSDGVRCNATFEVIAQPPIVLERQVEVLTIISPPNTGDGGLASASEANKTNAVYLALAAEGAAMVFFALGAVLVRRRDDREPASLE